MPTGRPCSSPLFRAAILGVIALTVLGSGCRRQPAVPDATYRQAVTAFYVSLAAMQTSQDVIARQELERVVQLVPDEAAAWANLGLTQMRLGELEAAAAPVERALTLAPNNADLVLLAARMEAARASRFALTAW